MSEEDVRRSLTRRDLVRATGVAGGAGLLAGGGLGYVLGGDSEDAPSGTEAASGPPLNVVAAVDRTPTFAATATEITNGARMAVDEINGRGGILGRSVELKPFDIGSAVDPAKVRNAFTRIVADEPAMVLSPYILPPGPDCEVSADAGVLYLHYSTQASFIELYERDPERFRTVFMMDPPETIYGSGFAVFMDELVETGAYEPRDRSAAVLASDDAYGQGIAAAFEDAAKKLGWKITNRSTVQFGQTVDWGPILAPIRSNPPALVFSTNPAPPDNIQMAKQWARSPLPSLLYQQFAPSTAEYTEAVGRTGDGILWSTVLGLHSDEPGRRFRKRYEERYKESAGWAYTAAGYDAVRMWAVAAALSGDPGNGEAVAPVLEQTIFRGIAGSISFPSGHTALSYPSQTPDPSLGAGQLIAQIRGGEGRQIFPEIYAISKFELPPWMT